MTEGEFDIGELDTAKASDEGAEIEILHPVTQAKTGVFFKILGKDSEVFREHVRNKVNERMRRDALASRRGKQPELMTAEQVEADAIELLVLVTLGWRSETRKGNKVTSEPHIVLRGEKLVYSIANAKRVFTEFVEIRRQVDDAVGDLENFIQS